MFSISKWFTFVALAAFLSLGGPSLAFRGGYQSAPNAVPTVSALTQVISSPVSNGGAVATATCSANCSGITWAITAGNSAGNFAINGSTGAITTTSSGVTNIVDLKDAFSLTIQATNGVGPGTNTAAITAYLDGSVNAPACGGASSFQNATLLSGYTFVPPWKKAGIDYCVGVDNSVTLSDPVPSGTLAAGLTALGCSGTGVITCSGTNCNNSVIQGWDFSLHNNSISIGTCTNPTIKNNKFVISTNKVIITLATTTNGPTVTNNYMDSNGFGVVGQGMILSNAFGTVLIEYNYMINAPGEQIVTGGTGSGTSNITRQYNVFRNAQQQSGFHGDWDQDVTSGFNIGAENYNFNLAYEDNPAYSTQGFSIMTAAGVTSGSYASVSVSYNLFPTFDSTNKQPNYFMLISSVWLNGTSTVVGNYVDKTNVGTDWMFYGNDNGSGSAGFATPLTTCNGNVNMITGANLTTYSGNLTTGPCT